MIRVLVLAIILSFSSAASAASLNTTLFFNSNYIYKGLSFTNGGVLEPAATGGPAIQGSLDLTHEWFGWTLFTGNVNSWDAITYQPEADMELDSMLYVTFPAGPLTLQFNFNNFNYILNPINNMLDVAAHVAYEDFRLNLSATHMPGWNTDLGYAQLVFTPRLTDEIMLTSHIGYSTLSTTDWGYSNYADYKIGMAYMRDGWYAEAYYTNTLGRLNYATNQYINTDAALTVTVAKTFSVFANKG